eukprot:TRINITY_DN32_c1_g1_i1.p1 TRINITY_DN32_c1_g1~~TRINITY_DN32_c1_g1_i1.p1  ORF type:complete len:262 (-),score=31.04 TRINITY_DN32_c1_g1_i1:342-1127(-)
MGITFAHRYADDDDGLGWQVFEVGDGSLADYMEIKRGDVVYRIGGEIPGESAEERRRQGRRRPVTWEFCRPTKLHLGSPRVTISNEAAQPPAFEITPEIPYNSSAQVTWEIENLPKGSLHDTWQEVEHPSEISMHDAWQNRARVGKRDDEKFLETNYQITHRFSQPDLESALTHPIITNERRKSTSMMQDQSPQTFSPHAIIRYCKCLGCQKCSHIGLTTMSYCLNNAYDLSDAGMCEICRNGTQIPSREANICRTRDSCC